MTRDEVMALTDEELRIKAAELAGWHRIAWATSDRSATTYMEKPWTAPDSTAFSECPDYPHDIAAAWELIEEFSEATMTLQTLTEDMKPDPEPPHYPCEEVNFDLGPNPDWPNSQVCEFRRNGESWAHTTARAITRAFILAMEDSE